jgi:hypothetical protein
MRRRADDAGRGVAFGRWTADLPLCKFRSESCDSILHMKDGEQLQRPTYPLSSGERNMRSVIPSRPSRLELLSPQNRKNYTFSSLTKLRLDIYCTYHRLQSVLFCKRIQMACGPVAGNKKGGTIKQKVYSVSAGIALGLHPGGGSRGRTLSFRSVGTMAIGNSIEKRIAIASMCPRIAARNVETAVLPA